MITIDFEFYNSNEPHPTLVCAAMDGKTYWLLDGSDNERLKQDILSKDLFLAYYAIAEARCFISLGLDPLKFKWIDLYVEFRMQQNSQNKYQYGKYIEKTGQEKNSFPPVVGEENEQNNTKVPSNLINAVFKNTGHKISSAEKEHMRDIILSKDKNLITQNKDRIMEYCLEDTKHLIPLYENISSSFQQNGLRNFEKDMLSRGSYAAATAKCEQIGIPINLALLNKIIEKTPDILKESQQSVNTYIPMFVDEYTPPPKIFKNGKVHNYVTIPAHKDTRVLQRFIDSLPEKQDWPKTDTKLYKTDKETLETFRYIPAIEILYRHSKNESSLKWFNKNNGDGFFDALGSDGNVRPFYGIFGTQTGRNAAKAKTFPPAMSSWLRAIIQPPKGFYIIGADFSQQEVAVAAELSGDNNLRLAYDSGDVYLEFAKQAGLVPHNATKKTHKAERDLCKSTVLGLQYGMGKFKLQRKLSYDSGSPVSMEKTIELIDAHKNVFSTYWDWVRDFSNQYERGYPIITKDGWVLWQDNQVITSVRNMPVQGNSASITRRAVVLAWEAGLTVLFQLHDALYCLSDNVQQTEEIMRKVMRQATIDILGKNCIDIRSDFKVVSNSDYWVEEKGAQEWEKIKKHLKLD